MKLYIKVENGVAVNHPQDEKNLLEVYGEVPSGFEPFTKVEKPLYGDEEDEVNKYKKLTSEQPSYQQVDGVWTEVWNVIDMTESERTEKDNMLKNKQFTLITVSEP